MRSVFVVLLKFRSASFILDRLFNKHDSKETRTSERDSVIGNTKTIGIGPIGYEMKCCFEFNILGKFWFNSEN